MNIYKARHGKDPYAYYSRRALADKFPYIPQQTIGRLLSKMEEDGYLLSKIDNKYKYDKTKSYLVNTLAHLGQSVAQNEPPIAQNEPTIPSLSSSPNTIMRSPKGETHDSKGLEARGLAVTPTPDGENPRAERVKKVTPEIEQVFTAIRPGSAVPGYWIAHRAQREAAARLFKERGLEAVKKAMEFYRENQSDPFCPLVTNPFDLEKNWSKLAAFKRKKS